mmetsp:Transcript_31472/g.70479  ORF Transcript_31472/g.70479 Transcript_31472/m.70479 type:complete len:611 (-) Transcript_31472:23-1855(-)
MATDGVLPFYSTRVKELLGDAAKVEAYHHGSTGGALGGRAVRGKFSGAGDSDHSDDDIDSDGEVHDSKGSSEDEEDTPCDKDEGGRRRRSNPGGSSKQEAIKRLGSAPSFVCSLDGDEHVVEDTGSDTVRRGRRCLQVPTVLLPVNYLRNNPNWRPSLVAKLLLGSWSQISAGTVVVVLLQSGRFAAAVFSLHDATRQIKMIAHKTSTRYTVRKGQGGAQSNHDQSKNKANSMGAQLRREGEKQLREDTRKTWNEWKKAGHIENAAFVFASCPKVMRREYLFEDGNGGVGLVEKTDERLRNIPLDVGRPTMEGTAAVLDVLMRCVHREMSPEEQTEQLAASDETIDHSPAAANLTPRVAEKKGEIKERKEEPEHVPLTPLHQAILDDNLSQLLDQLQMLETTEEQGVGQPVYDVNTSAGPDNQTPLHMAAASNRPEFVKVLMINGHANATILDGRGRVPYFLASADKQREAFRLARGSLGEDYCSWDEDAKVGPALSDADLQAKKAKAAEKKRRQRQRQKEKKAREKNEEERETLRLKAEEERNRQMEEAKRVRDGLQAKPACLCCDFCGKRVKRRSDMLRKLQYVYCTTECVKRHQRELMAARAEARMK